MPAQPCAAPAGTLPGSIPGFASGPGADVADRAPPVPRGSPRRRRGAGVARARIRAPLLHWLPYRQRRAESGLGVRSIRARSSRFSSARARSRLRGSAEVWPRRGVRAASRRLGARSGAGDRRDTGTACRKRRPAFLWPRSVQSGRRTPLYIGEPIRGRYRSHRGVGDHGEMAADPRVVEPRSGASRDTRAGPRHDARGGERRNPHPP